MCRQTLKKMVKVLEEKIMKINAIHVHEMQHLVQENVHILHEISDLNQKFHRLSMIFKDLQVLQTHLSTINDLISYNKKVRKLTICIITS
jgi:precorrin-6B methylase 1